MTKIQYWGVLFLLLFLFSYPTVAQVRITDTPVSVIIPEATLQPTSVQLLTATPTLTTTPEGPSVFLEAVAASADINVRDFPDVTGGYLGSLQQGVQYPVTGRFFAWFQFEYETSPTGVAWVYGSLVRIVGDEAEIPNIDPNAVPEPEDDPTLEAQLRLLTPEFANTATAEARNLTIPTGEFNDSDNPFPPTFTPPANAVARQPTQDVFVEVTPSPTPDLLDTAVTTITSGNIPPILPILGLGLFGFLGLIVSLIRR